MRKLDCLAYKMNSYDTEEFIKKILSYSENSLILIFDFEKIVLRYKLQGLHLNREVWKFYSIKNKHLMNILMPVLFLLNIFMIFGVLFNFCLKYRPIIFWTENVYAACMAGFFKKIGLCKKSFYVPGDWLVNPNNRKFLSFVANNLMFPFLDYFACRMSTMVLYGNERLRDVRERFWGKKISRNERLCPFAQFPGISLKISGAKKNSRAMCFLGDRRLDSGLDIAIKALPEIRKHYDIVLKAIGPIRENDDHFRDLAKYFQVTPFVEFNGYLESHELSGALEDCFCGLNMLTIKDSYSYYGFPGKQVHYLQHLLPIILTEGAGSLAPVVQENFLGMVIEPTVEAFCQAVIKVYNEQAVYRNNILKFINNIQPIDIKELFEPDLERR